MIPRDLDDKNIDLQITMQFLANLINEIETRKAGYSMPVRWLCLRDDLRSEYLIKAANMVATWWADEQKAKLSRESHTVP